MVVACQTVFSTSSACHVVVVVSSTRTSEHKSAHNTLFMRVVVMIVWLPVVVVHALSAKRSMSLMSVVTVVVHHKPKQWLKTV